MNRKPVFLIALLFLVSISSVTLRVQSVEASGTVYIRADGSIDPPTAPISTLDNVTYILTGNITSDDNGIVVGMDNIVVDGSGFSIEGTGADYGIYLDGRSNATIQNTNINNFDNGILLLSSSNNSISGNNMTNSNYGIALDSSTNNTINGNNMKNNSHGIGVGYSSDFNSISGNTFANNSYGIWLGYSSDNSVFRNNFINNTVQVDGNTPEYANSWDDGREGNYWSNYDGADANHDGIGDTPYGIDANNTDHYPLMNVIPEFPSLLMLPLFMMATSLAVILYKRRRAKLSRATFVF
jgi:parallel beta-helix repeat protein